MSRYIVLLLFSLRNSVVLRAFAVYLLCHSFNAETQSTAELTEDVLRLGDTAYSEETSGSVAGCSSATHDTNRRNQFSVGSAICTPTRAVP